MNQDLKATIGLVIVCFVFGTLVGIGIFNYGFESGSLMQQQNTIQLGADKYKEGIITGINLLWNCEKNCNTQSSNTCLSDCLNKNKGW